MRIYPHYPTYVGYSAIYADNADIDADIRIRMAIPSPYPTIPPEAVPGVDGELGLEKVSLPLSAAEDRCKKQRQLKTTILAMLIYSRYLRLLRLQTRNIAYSCSAEKHLLRLANQTCNLPAYLIPDTKPDQTPVNVTLLQYIDVEVKIYDLNGTLVFEK